jgi:hypothetical protein
VKTDSSLKRSHSVPLLGLLPGTPYRCLIKATAANGKTYRSNQACATAPVGPATASVKNGSFMLNGKASFLWMGTASDCPTVDSVRDSKALGVYILDDGLIPCREPSPFTAMHTVLEGQALWHPHSNQDMRYLTGLPELLNPGVSINVNDNTYLLKCSAHSALPLLDSLKTSSKPVVYELPIAVHVYGPGDENCLDGLRLKLLAWTAIRGGAKGMKLFSHLPWDLKQGMQVKENLKTPTAELYDQVAVLSPVILYGKIFSIASTPTSTVGATAWLSSRQLYVDATNPVDTASDGSLSIAGAGNKLATVIGENRVVRMHNGVLRDHFGGFAAHWYRIDLGPILAKKK